MGEIFSFQRIIDFFTPDRLTIIARIVLTLVIGLVFFRLLAFILGLMTRKRLSSQASMIVRKFTFYIGAIIIILIVLGQAGVSFAALLGTAGVLGIAVGFAAQKSISNLISGLFLLSEKPFAVDDVISVGEHRGIVTSVDLLSVKIRTFNNQYVRIPNELILNTEVVNITRYPIRRLDLYFTVGLKQDLRKVEKVLLQIANSCEICLDEPEPLYFIDEFGEQGIRIMFGVWFEKPDFISVHNEMMIRIQRRFEEEGIEITVPLRTIYSPASAEPIPVDVRGKNSGKLTARKRNSGTNPGSVK